MTQSTPFGDAKGLKPTAKWIDEHNPQVYLTMVVAKVVIPAVKKENYPVTLELLVGILTSQVLKKDNLDLLIC